MAIDIKTLRAGRDSVFSKIVKEFDNDAKGGEKSYNDDRFWKPERDKAGNATATIRFLNRTDGDELPWVKIFSHGFKGPTGRWYIENSLTTIGQPDPCSELNSKLWNASTDNNGPERKQAREQKRRLNYIANILIVNDPKHPELNGQVKLFKFGKKIFDKIMDKARPTFEDEEPINVFDYWEGANFKLRMKTIDKYPNYDASEFEGKSPVAGDDEEILKIVNQQYKLSEFTDPSNFKSYDELKRKLEQVLNGQGTGQTAAAMAEDEDFTPTYQKAEPKSLDTPQPKSKPAPADDDDEDMLSYFQSLADGD